VRSGNAIWMVRAPAGAPVSPRRAGAGVLARAVGVAALAAGAALGLAPGAAPAVAPSGTAARAAAPEPAAKDGARLAAWAPAWGPARGPARDPARAPAAAPAWAPAAATAWAETSRMFAPRLAAAPAQARFVKGEPAVTGSLVPGPFAPAPAASAGAWREEEFQQVQALDGRTLATPAVRIRLSGLALPAADEVCRTLDGRLEACAARAATQLELMTRHRTVSCRYRADASGEAAGTCRIGATDLAERMVRTGFAKRLPEAGRVAMAAPASAAN
jgi:hypothetical protein